MRKSTCLLSAIVVLSLTQLILSQTGQSGKRLVSGDVLERKVPGNSLEYLTTRDAFGQALAAAHGAGGIASVASECEEAPITQRWMPLGASLRDVLDLIVAADPGYQWTADDDVVNLLPKESIPALLETPIKRFRLSRPTDLDSALAQLLARPEVRQRESELHTSTGLKLFVGGASKNDPKIILNCKNLTLREALNAIVQAYGKAVWSYRERHCGGQKVYSIDFIAR